MSSFWNIKKEMIEIRKYKSNQAQEWDLFVEAAKNGIFMFERKYMDYHSDRFTDYSLMFYRDGEELIAVLPASLHGTELRSHGGLTYGGMLCGYQMKQHLMNECFEVLIDYLRKEGITEVLYKHIPHFFHKYPSEEELYPLWRHGAQLVRRDVSSVIDLSCPIKMPKGRKAQISRAKREGVIVNIEETFDEFIALENQVLQEYHSVQAVHTGAELALLHSRFPKQIKLYTARKNGELIAGSLLFVYDDVVHTQYMASSELGREIGGLDLVVATMMEEHKNTKHYFDFGISTDDVGRSFNAGLCSQKEGFGGRTVCYDFYRLKI